MPNYFVDQPMTAIAILEHLQHSNLFLQFDIYHAQRSGGELISSITRNIDRIAHIQLADNPGRHQPGTGEINFSNIFKAIDNSGYQGWIGCEYHPSGSTHDSLDWLRMQAK